MTALSRIQLAASLLDLESKKVFTKLTKGSALAAAGSSNTNAAAISDVVTFATAADGTKGVILPKAEIDAKYTVVNTTSSTLPVYPDAGSQINALTVTTGGFTVMPNSQATFICDAALHWYVAALASATGAQPGAAASGVIRAAGNLNMQVSAAGLGNGADTTDDVLFTYALPASALDVAGRQVTIIAAGKTAATANNKRIKVWWGTTTQTVGAAVAGGTLIVDSLVITTNAGGWTASVQVEKYGAAGSNTQLASSAQVAAGVAHLGTAVPVALTATESGVINITVTGASPTTGAANDVLGQVFDVAFNN